MTEQNAKHTPGPWTVSEYMSRTAGGEVITAGKTQIAEVVDFNEYARDAERKANARLIAAAPDGYALAKRFLAIALDVTSKGTSARPTVRQLNELFEMAQAVERKVEG